MYADYHECHGHGGHYSHHHGGYHHEHGYHHDCAIGEGKPDAESELVCPCVGVTRAGIEQAVANGARTLEDVESATGAGTRCGRCTEAVEACLQEALAAQAS
ncbi:MAG: (2Fe-2S)-binding protein [Olsenella sp.]|nr:(2Fe-2S)-binding protein [Olsenella sp.]